MQKPALIILAALSLALAAPLAPSFAQTPPPAPPLHGPHGGGGGRLKKLSGELGLTDAQKAQMKPILMSSRQQTRAVLTPDQQAKLKSIRQAKREAKEGTAEDN